MHLGPGLADPGSHVPVQVVGRRRARGTHGDEGRVARRGPGHPPAAAGASPRSRRGHDRAQPGRGHRRHCVRPHPDLPRHPRGASRRPEPRPPRARGAGRAPRPRSDRPFRSPWGPPRAPTRTAFGHPTWVFWPDWFKAAWASPENRLTNHSGDPLWERFDVPAEPPPLGVAGRARVGGRRHAGGCLVQQLLLEGGVADQHGGQDLGGGFGPVPVIGPEQAPDGGHAGAGRLAHVRARVGRVDARPGHDPAAVRLHRGAGAVYDPIVGFDAQDKPAPTGLASKWTNSADLKTWTFTLRPGITFTDGTPVNAAGGRTQVNAQKALPDCGCQADMAHISNVEAVDDLTVRFTLDQANVSFPGLLAGNAGYLAAPCVVGRRRGHHDLEARSARAPSRCSPRARSPSSGTRRTGARAPRAMRCRTSTRSRSSRCPTRRLASPSLRDGKVDIIQTADTLNLVQAKKDPPWSSSRSPAAARRSSCSTRTRPPFDDIRLRQAFNYALDREALNKGYYGDSRLPAYGPLEPVEPVLRPQRASCPAYDLAKAKALVGQAEGRGQVRPPSRRRASTPPRPRASKRSSSASTSAAGMSPEARDHRPGHAGQPAHRPQRQLPGVVLPQLAGRRPRRPVLAPTTGPVDRTCR